jgi:hypothetical protein
MSTLKVDTIQDTNAVEMYLCKAWVNFDGTWTSGDPIRASGNVSSITDNGTGDYTITFTNAMEDANWCMTHSHGSTVSANADDDGGAHTYTKSSTTARVYVGFGTSNGNIYFYDYDQIDLAFFR